MRSTLAESQWATIAVYLSKFYFEMDILVERFLQEEAQTFYLEINVDNNPLR